MKSQSLLGRCSETIY